MLLEKIELFNAEMNRVQNEIEAVRAELRRVRTEFAELKPLKQVVAEIHGGKSNDDNNDNLGNIDGADAANPGGV